MLNQIIEKYYSRVYAFALVHVISEDIAKDLTQDVFLELARRAQDLRKLDDVEAYVFTVARYRTYQHFKKIQRNQALKAEMLRAYEEKYEEPELSIIAGDLEEKFQAFIDQLPDRQREIYRMSREKGMSYQEIADQLNISPHTVRNHLAQAVKTLKVYYG